MAFETHSILNRQKNEGTRDRRQETEDRSSGVAGGKGPLAWRLESKLILRNQKQEPGRAAHSATPELLTNVSTRSRKSKDLFLYAKWRDSGGQRRFLFAESG